MQEIEKLYKNKLKNHETSVSDDVWDNIAQTLNKQNRKRRVPIWYIIAIVLLLTAFLSYILVNRINNTPIKRRSKIEKSNSLPAAVIKKDYNEPSLKSNNDKEDKLMIAKQSNTIKEHKNLKVFSNLNVSISPAISLNHSYLKESNNLDTYTNIHKRGFNSENTIANTSKVHHKNKIIPLNKIIFNKKFSLITSTPSLNSGFLFGDKRTGILNDCFPIKRNFLYVEGYYSNDYNKKTLNGDNSEFIKNRNATESNIYSYSFGLMFGYLMSNGFTIKAGVNYTNINERFKIVFKNIVSTQTIITIDTIMNPDGSFTEVRDTTIKEIFGERTIQDQNRYSMLDIPLIIGLNYKRFNHKIGINTGIIINIISRQKGTILSHVADTHGTKEFGYDNIIFRKNLGISIYVGLSYSYRFMSRYELFFEPNIRYYIRSFTEDYYPLSQKYTKYGISLGGRYIF